MADNSQSGHSPVPSHEHEHPTFVVNEGADHEYQHSGDEGEEGGVPLPSSSPQPPAEGQDRENGLIARYHQHEEQLLKPVTAGWLKRNGEYFPSDNFIPLPFITFTIDRPTNLLCMICKVSVLTVEETCESDCNPSIMPCGHVAGSACLERCFADADRRIVFHCPSCRQSLNHTGCVHRVKERRLTTESIRTLPRTLPYGGKIADTCTECRVDKAQERQREFIESVTAELEAVRKEHEAHPTSESTMLLAGYVEELTDAVASQHRDTIKALDESEAW